MVLLSSETVSWRHDLRTVLDASDGYGQVTVALWAPIGCGVREVMTAVTKLELEVRSARASAGSDIDHGIDHGIEHDIVLVSELAG